MGRNGAERRADVVAARRGKSAPATSPFSIPLGAVVLVAVSLLPDSASSQAAAGFTFCVAPHRPACVSDSSSSASAEVCDKEVNAYIRTVFRYRECLETESQRAVRESNDVIDEWRCKQSGERCRN